MKLTFWLLDVNYEVKDGTPALWLWGIDAFAERVLIVDRSFLAYFYAVMEEHADPVKIVESVENEQYESIIKLEVVGRKFFGKTVKAVKVYCRNPDEISKCSRDLRAFEGIKECFEDDIRYSMRYLIDNNVVPCGWHEVEVAEERSDRAIRVEKIYAAKTPPRLLKKLAVPPLRILGFSTICYSRQGSPKPDRNPVVMISVRTNSGEEQLLESSGERKNCKTLSDFFG